MFSAISMWANLKMPRQDGRLQMFRFRIWQQTAVSKKHTSCFNGVGPHHSPLSLSICCPISAVSLKVLKIEKQCCQPWMLFSTLAVHSFAALRSCLSACKYTVSVSHNIQIIHVWAHFSSSHPVLFAWTGNPAFLAPLSSIPVLNSLPHRFLWISFHSFWSLFQCFLFLFICGQDPVHHRMIILSRSVILTSFLAKHTTYDAHWLQHTFTDMAITHIVTNWHTVHLMIFALWSTLCWHWQTNTNFLSDFCKLTNLHPIHFSIPFKSYCIAICHNELSNVSLLDQRWTSRSLCLSISTSWLGISGFWSLYKGWMFVLVFAGTHGLSSDFPFACKVQHFCAL